MVTDKLDLFFKSLMFRKVRRWLKNHMQPFISLSVDDLEYAAERNLDLMGHYLEGLPMDQRARRKEIAPWRPLVRAITVDDILEIVREESPAHAAIFARHRQWFNDQVQKLRDDLALGEGGSSAE